MRIINIAKQTQQIKKMKERDGNYMKTKIKQSKCNTTNKRTKTTTIYD